MSGMDLQDIIIYDDQAKPKTLLQTRTKGGVKLEKLEHNETFGKPIGAGTITESHSQSAILNLKSIKLSADE
ncbi:MAG: hypothetical protein ACK521_00895 [bacterium]|jgi:hypothetical protein